MRNESSSLPVSFTVVQNQTQCLWPPVIFKADWRQLDMCVIYMATERQRGREGTDETLSGSLLARRHIDNRYHHCRLFSFLQRNGLFTVTIII